jgi:beta-lactamase class A
LKPLSLLLSLAATMAASSIDTAALTSDFQKLASGFKGRIGVCVLTDDKQKACLNTDSRFSIQSVMKLMLGMAVLERVDNKVWTLDKKVLIHRKDLGPFHKPIAKLVGPNGYEATIGELVRRAVADSDNGACEVLIDQLGGIQVVQAYLTRKGIQGMRLDRDERTLQTEIIGLTWKTDYVDDKALDKAAAAVPDTIQAAAYKKYQTDIRDTSTPLGMAEMLLRLRKGQLLSPASTRYLLDIMESTTTGPDRLKAGISSPWKLAHKTGTSGTYKGMAAATNDVGILHHPNGTTIAVAVFVGDSTESPARRASIMADLARATLRHIR